MNTSERAKYLVGFSPSPCPVCVRRHVLAARAHLEDAAAHEEGRGDSMFRALGHLAAAEDNARSLAGKSPVPAGALTTIRAALERGDAAASSLVSALDKIISTLTPKQ